MKIFASGVGEHAGAGMSHGVELRKRPISGEPPDDGVPAVVGVHSPASKSAADTWPSSRARSSSVSVCLSPVLTSSMPKKYLAADVADDGQVVQLR